MKHYPKELFQSNLDACELHADRIEKALKEVEQFFPLTVEKLALMDTHQLAVTELLTGRFSKLQDTVGERIFPHLLSLLGEDIERKSFIDKLNKLEKLGYIDKAEDWFVYRRARNAIAHEYPDNPELMLKNLLEVIDLSRKLLVYWKDLDKKIKKLI